MTHPEFNHLLFAPGFTNIADPRTGSATLCAPSGKRHAGKIKTPGPPGGPNHRDTDSRSFSCAFSGSPSLHGSILRFGVNHVSLYSRFHSQYRNLQPVPLTASAPT